MNEVGRAIDAVVQPSAPTASLLPPRASSRVKPARIPRCHVEVLFIVARERPVSEPSSVFFFSSLFSADYRRELLRRFFQRR